MKIVLTELEMKEAIADYMAKQASSVEIIKMDPVIIPDDMPPLGLELGKNTMEQPFKPEVKYAPPAPVKRTRGPNKKTNTPIVELSPMEAVAGTNTAEPAPTVAKESDPFILNETAPVEESGTDKLELDSPTEEISDEVNLFA
jgi:hypothetical protein